MSWSTALLIGIAVGLVVLVLSVWRRPLRSFKWALLDEVDLSPGFLADNVTLYWAGELVEGHIELRAEGLPSFDSLKLIGVKVWNGGFRAIEPSDFPSGLPIYVTMTNLIALVSVTELRPGHTLPSHSAGFPIQIHPTRLRAGEGFEVRVLTQSRGYISIHDDFTRLKVQRAEGAPRRGWTWLQSVNEWRRRNMDIRIARIVEPVIAAVLITLLVRVCFGEAPE